MKDLSDKSKLSKQPDTAAAPGQAAAPQKHGRFHHWRWNFKYFMYCWGFRSFMPPKPYEPYFYDPKFKISETELRKCPPDKTYEQYEMELREKAYNEAVYNWRHGEEYIAGERPGFWDFSVLTKAFKEGCQKSETPMQKFVFWGVVLLLLFAFLFVFTAFVYFTILPFFYSSEPIYHSPFGN